MIRNISDEEARHMVELLKKKSVLIKNFLINLRNTEYQEIEKCMIRRLENY